MQLSQRSVKSYIQSGYSLQFSCCLMLYHELRFALATLSTFCAKGGYAMGALERLDVYREGPVKKYLKSKEKSAGGEKNRTVPLNCIRSLVEGIILQAIEDLWDNDHHQESVFFLKGEGFNICASLAQIDMEQRYQIVRLVTLALAKKRNGTAPDKKR